ncbi:SDR family oxidoreductase [Parahaliea sp. F7430]|uniref:SDR family oxidoreductase n=1 Tax=Sediminihaliea albiluteola TaxID=2758564 RepID=A0A7W2TXT3_9GAMM|nr:SDR family oxidoreductase [Sediminihaliea albiluteola]MBA6413774.1 SDR family oxidoreductase [Sediminihaliea albiluteola]
MNRLHEKVVLITGANRGMGHTAAKLLAQEGALVIATDINDSGLEELSGMGIDSRILDVTSEDAWRDTVEAIVKKYGRLDVLVNNAGIVHVADPVTFDLNEWRQMCAVNVEGTMLGCKYALPVMSEQGAGSIVNIASISAHTGLYFYSGYCASKGAVAAYTRAVAVYCAQNQLGIRCNSISPGGIDTKINEDLAEQFAQRLASMKVPPQSPVSADGPQMRMGEHEDIGWAIVYLASDESKFMNGSDIRIDNSSSITAAAVA